MIEKIATSRKVFIKDSGILPNRIFMSLADFKKLPSRSVGIYGMNICLNLRLEPGNFEFKRLSYES